MEILPFVTLAENPDNSLRNQGDLFVDLIRLAAEDGNVWPLLRAIRESNTNVGGLQASATLM